MRVGIFDLEIIEVRNSKGEIRFQPTFKIGGKIIQTYGLWKREKDAYDAGIKALTELFQDALDQFPKTKYQTKPKPVDAVQWFTELRIEGIYNEQDRYWYFEIPIHPGNWIVDGKLYSNTVFNQLFEVVS